MKKKKLVMEASLGPNKSLEMKIVLIGRGDSASPDLVKFTDSLDFTAN